MAHRLVSSVTPLAFGAVILFVTTGASGQTPTLKPTSKAAWAPPRTPWGDPDLQGTFTNKDENGIPLERPSQFDGRKIEDVKSGELADLIAQRQKFLVTLAPTLGGAETGAGPVHWFEYYGLSNILSAARAEEKASAR